MGDNKVESHEKSKTKRFLAVFAIVLAVIAAHDLGIAYLVNHDVTKNKHIFVAEFEVPLVLKNNNVNGAYATKKVLEFIKIYNSTPEHIDEEIIVKPLPKGWSKKITSIVPKFIESFTRGVIVAEWDGFVRIWFEWIYKNQGIVQGKIIKEDSLYITSLSISNDEKMTIEDEEIGPEFWKKLATALATSFQPCRAIIYAFNNKEPSEINSATSKSCQTKLSKTEYLQYFYIAIENLVDGDLASANNNIKNAISKIDKTTTADVLSIGQHIKNELFWSEQIGEKEFVDFLEKYGGFIKDYPSYNRAMLIFNFRVAKDIEKVEQYFSKIANNSNNIDAKLIAGLDLKDRKSSLAALRGAENTSIVASMLLFYWLQESQSEEDKKESIILAKRALKNGESWAIWATFTLIFNHDYLSINEPLDEVINWLDDDSLPPNPYYLFTTGMIKAFKQSSFCVNVDATTDFKDALHLLNNEEKKSAFNYFLRGFIHLYGLAGRIDYYEAVYLLGESSKMVSKMPTHATREIRALLFIYGENRDVDRGLKVLQEEFEEYILSAKYFADPQAEAPVFNDILGVISVVDNIVINFTKPCSKDGKGYQPFSYYDILLAAEYLAGYKIDNNIDENLISFFEFYYQLYPYYLALEDYKGSTSTKVKNFESAFTYFLFSAINEFAESQYYLARMYSNGQGVEKSCALAHYWMNNAVANGSELAKKTKLGGCEYVGDKYSIKN